MRGFYESHSSAHIQNVDDAFCAFVWSLIVQQPTVRVGLMPEGVTSEVWIAPQTSAKRKANARGEAHVEMQPSELSVVSDAKLRPLAELQAEYGDKLRIACDSDAIYASITGSHIRVSSLSICVLHSDTEIGHLVFKTKSYGVFCAADHHAWSRERRYRGGTRNPIWLRPKDVFLSGQTTARTQPCVRQQFIIHSITHSSDFC